MISGARETKITGHGIWSHDAHVFMQDVSHLRLIATSLLQTCSYITEQMQAPVTIDVNKFLDSFSINTDGGNIHLPSWIAGEDDSVIFSDATTIIPDSQSSSHTESSNVFTMDDYSRCRRAEAIRWIDLQEKRASIMARLHPVTPEEYQRHRDDVKLKSGPICRKGIYFHFSRPKTVFIHYIFI
jgi:hypothetical protein